MAEELGGIDFSQYQSWETITAPTGAVYYKVPNSGYVYDPFLSQAKGRPVLWTNPEPQVKERDEIKRKEQEAEDLRKEQSSPLGQLLPVAGATGAAVAGNYLIKQLPSPLEKIQAQIAEQALAKAPTTVGQSVAQATAPVTSQSAIQSGATVLADPVTGQTLASGLPTSAADAFAAGVSEAGTLAAGSAVPSGYTAIGTAADGSLMVAPTSALGNIAPEATNITNFAGSYTPYLGGAAALAGGYSLAQGIENNDPISGGLGGLGLGGGLAAMGLISGGLPVLAGSALVGALLGGFGDELTGDKDMWKTEGDRLKKLKEQGVFVPDGLIESMPTKGRSKEELVALEQSRGGNVQFAQSRNEADLKPQDIIGYSVFAENDPNWFKRPLQEQLDFAQKALDAGAVREHHGTIDVEFGKLKKAPNPPTAATAATPAQAFSQGAGTPMPMVMPNRPPPLAANPMARMSRGPVADTPPPPVAETAEALQMQVPQGNYIKQIATPKDSVTGLPQRYQPAVPMLGVGSARERLATPEASSKKPPTFSTRLTPEQIGKILAKRMNNAQTPK